MNDRPLAREAGLITESVGDELVVYDTFAQAAHCLSPSAATVFTLCDGHRTTTEIALGAAVNEDEAVRALEELSAAGLLSEAPRLVTEHGPRAATTGLTRREATKRFARIGAAAVTAPLVLSVAIPHPAFAASTGGSGLCEGVNCPDIDFCHVNTCDPSTGDCVASPVNCDDNNACTIDECDSISGCVHTPMICDDSNACTKDTCDPMVGCVYTPIVCADDNPCTIDSCDPIKGCVFPAVPDGTTCPGGTCQAGMCVPQLPQP